MLYASAMLETPRRPWLFRAWFWLALGLASCENPRDPGGGGRGPSGPPLGRPSTPLSPDGSKVPLSEAPTEPAPAPERAPAPSAPEASHGGRFELGEIQDAGPAAPMAAHTSGIFFITKSGGMYIARRKDKELTGIDAPRDAFFRFGRGPALSPTHAYWVSSQGQLERAPLTGGSPEVLTKARSGGRVSVLYHEQDLVFYLAEEGDNLRAMLYTAQHNAKRISPDGANVTSLSVVENGAFPRALMLEGRSGMSPLHARTIRLRKNGPELGPDEVVWVGPGSSPLTEVRASAFRGTGGAIFIAMPRSASKFGLALLTLLPTGLLAREPTWRPYENGIDPAPSEIVQACGKTFLLFALPTSRTPRAPQELRIGELEPNGLAREETLVRARAFNDISAAPLSGTPSSSKTNPSGFLLAWTADHRTWGLVVSCPKGVK